MRVVPMILIDSRSDGEAVLEETRMVIEDANMVKKTIFISAVDRSIPAVQRVVALGSEFPPGGIKTITEEDLLENIAEEFVALSRANRDSTKCTNPRK